jgi:hypothetical protein
VAHLLASLEGRVALCEGGAYSLQDPGPR